jgi:hypothetical protein
VVFTGVCIDVHFEKVELAGQMSNFFLEDLELLAKLAG